VRSLTCRCRASAVLTKCLSSNSRRRQPWRYREAYVKSKQGTHCAAYGAKVFGGALTTCATQRSRALPIPLYRRPLSENTTPFIRVEPESRIKRPSHVCSFLSIDKVPPALTTLPKELLPKRAHSQSHDCSWRANNYRDHNYNGVLNTQQADWPSGMA
jgi:hypothetical protein